MQYKLIQSKFWIKCDLEKHSTTVVLFRKRLSKAKTHILEQNIPTIQAHIQSGSLNYETLTQWYLYRIVK
jgi:amidase